MLKIIVITTGFLLFSCTDWPTKDNQENEANPINIKIDIDNRLEEASDNESMDVKVDSESKSDSKSDSESKSSTDNKTTSVIRKALWQVM